MLTLFIITLLILLVATHELGHMYAAIKCGVPVTEFSIGLGPRLFVKTVRGVKVSLKLFPIGGSCEMDQERFNGASLWQKNLILAAGCIVNFLDGCVLASASVLLGRGIVDGFSYIPEAIISLAAAPVTALANLGGIHLSDLGGPAKAVAELSGMAETFGNPVAAALALMAVMAFSLCFFNLLPVPPLDGGEIAYRTIERYFGRCEKGYHVVSGMAWLCLIWLTGFCFLGDITYFLG